MPDGGLATSSCRTNTCTLLRSAALYLRKREATMGQVTGCGTFNCYLGNCCAGTLLTTLCECHACSATNYRVYIYTAMRCILRLTATLRSCRQMRYSEATGISQELCFGRTYMCKSLNQLRATQQATNEMFTNQQATPAWDRPCGQMASADAHKLNRAVNRLLSRLVRGKAQRPLPSLLMSIFFSNMHEISFI